MGTKTGRPKLSWVCTGVALVGLVACGSDGIDEQAELQALLRDDPLTQVPPGAAAADGVDRNVVLPTADPLGVWDFDDCSPLRTNLFDGSGHDNTAFRSVDVACVAGLQGSPAVAIAAREDIVYVPDQPSFRFDDGVTVAGWFAPTATGGTRTLFRKRDRGTSSFALLLHGNRFELVVSLGEYRAIRVTSPAKLRIGVFQHVAATYDGSVARLYVDGIEVSQYPAMGTIPRGAGPLLIGNDGSERRFSGTIDSALFATHALTASEVLALTCLSQRPTMVATPTELATTPGQSVAIDIALTNHNPAACEPIRFELRTFDAGDSLALDPPPLSGSVGPPVPSGATSHMTVRATPSVSIEDPAAFDVQFEVSEPTTDFVDAGQAHVTVAEPADCHVRIGRELMITRSSVVDDPVRTAFDPASNDPRNGVWTFKHLIESIAATPEDAPAMVEAMLTGFTTDETLNGFPVAARPGLPILVLNRWPRTPDGALDLARAPLRLQAIVDRFDLRDLANGDAGEGRFVFAFNNLSPDSAIDALVIFEYKLPSATEQDVLGWAQSFHALGEASLGEDYNAALQAITERFVARGVRPGHINGSAIHTVRTNEFAFRATKHGFWEQRNFELSAATGRLEPALLALTPDGSFNASATLASYLRANAPAILAETHVVPPLLDGQPFQAGAVLNAFGAWTAPGADPEVRHHFSVNTCNGCHAPAETGVQFSQLRPRFGNREAGLSGFLTGITVPDPVTGQPRTFNDLGRRRADLQAIVCADPQAVAGRALRKGIVRAH